MQPEEFVRLGYPINAQYTAHVKPDDLNLSETLDDFYERSFALVRKILSKHSQGLFLNFAFFKGFFFFAHH